MSLPPELRVLCLQLSSTPVSDLPRLTPSLIRLVLRCHVPLSSHAGTAAKSDAPASIVLVHKLRTQLSSLLSGRSVEGRFSAVVLIKAVVEVGGWEILQGSELWVRGLLSILGKPDSSATKELSVIALTKIYRMTQPYQTLVREITTPTLPAYVTACLNLLSPTSNKSMDNSPSLAEGIFQSFVILIPHHTTIFRPFVSQIRATCRQYLAPTCSDSNYTSPVLKHSARRLVIVLHQTVAKGIGGEEWGKAVRDLVKSVHLTADIVFRAVIEDWESSTGHMADPVDINQEPSGGGRTAEDLPRWTGVAAGVDRLVGLVEMLSAYLTEEMSTPVSLPLGSVIDMITRTLSIAIPLSPESSVAKGGPRLHPAIDRDERENLWSGMPQVYVAAISLIDTLAERLQESFLPLSQGFLEQLAWLFPFGRHDTEFRLVTYSVLPKLLLYSGQSLGKASLAKLSTIIRSCCHDLSSVAHDTNGAISHKKSEDKRSGQNADTFLHGTSDVSQNSSSIKSDLIITAERLLPSLLSRLPQQYLDISIRSLIERTAILTHNKGAMLSSVIYPFVGKNGKAMASIMPHLSREFAHDDIVEILLRPRMPLLPTAHTMILNGTDDIQSEDEDMGFATNPTSSAYIYDLPSDIAAHLDTSSDTVATSNHPGLGPTAAIAAPAVTETASNLPAALQYHTFPSSKSVYHPEHSSKPAVPLLDTSMTEDSGDSDGSSVHLTMQLDTDSDEE